VTSENCTTRSGPDDEFLRALRRIAREVDAPPAGVVAGASAAFAWRTIDADLASLLLEAEPAPALGDW
jgi:hypothetical protein